MLLPLKIAWHLWWLAAVRWRGTESNSSDAVELPNFLFA
jgi:hypothetical protein